MSSQYKIFTLYMKPQDFENFKTVLADCIDIQEFLRKCLATKAKEIRTKREGDHWKV
jgi:hypothetical protein